VDDSEHGEQVRKSARQRHGLLLALLTALISAAAALGGAWVGGQQTYRATVVSEEAQDRRDERRREIEARGTARLLVFELGEARSRLDAMLRSNRLFRLDPRYFIEIPAPERELVAGRLSPADFDTLFTAIGSVEAIGVLVNNVARPGRTGQRPIPAVRAEITRTRDEARMAQRVLARLAKLE